MTGGRAAGVGAGACAAAVLASSRQKAIVRRRNFMADPSSTLAALLGRQTGG